MVGWSARARRWHHHVWDSVLHYKHDYQYKRALEVSNTHCEDSDDNKDGHEQEWALAASMAVDLRRSEGVGKHQEVACKLGALGNTSELNSA